MKLTQEEIHTIQSLLEEIQLYRNNDEEPREMTISGLYDDERTLAKKLGIVL